jgi:hypothetical protein
MFASPLALFLMVRAGASPQLVHSGTPLGVSTETDCAMRTFAWEYGKTLQPRREGFKSLYDALQLFACGVRVPTVY